MKLLLVILSVAGLALSAPTRDLEEDLQDFLDLIPLDEIVELIRWYAANDEEVADVVRYLQGAEWAALVQAVDTHPSYQELVDWLLERDIDLRAITQTIRDFIASLETSRGTSRSLRDLVDAIIALLPLDDLLVLLNDKLENSEDFLALYEEISSVEAYNFVETIRYLDEVQRIAARLLEMGIDVTVALDVVYAFLGWPPQ